MDMTAILVAVLGSGLLSTIVTQLFTMAAKRREAKSGMASGIRLIIKDRLRFLCEKYVDQGWIYADELSDIIDLHKCYHDDLKGNGYLDTMMSKVKQLPVRGSGHH